MPPTPRQPMTDEQAELIAARIAAQMMPELRRIAEALVCLETQARADHDLLERHQHTLHGNGREGLVTTVSHLARVAKTAQWLAGIVIGVVITSAVGAFAYLLQTHPLP